MKDYDESRRRSRIGAMVLALMVAVLGATPWRATAQEPDVVSIEMQIGEFLSPSGHSGTSDTRGHDSAAEKVPNMLEDGAAWLAWANQHGRLNTLSCPQIMTPDNQTACIRVGSAVRPGLKMVAPDKGRQINRAIDGLSVEFTPRILPDDLVMMELDVEVSSVVNGSGTGSPIIGTNVLRTTVSAKDGQTIIFDGPMQRTEDGLRQLIIALTPRVNPKL